MQNAQNKKRPKNNSSGAVGVHFHKKSQSWHARIFVNGNRIHLGGFERIEDAKAAYLQARKKYNFHKNHGRN